jgi:hypothetical protein
MVSILNLLVTAHLVHAVNTHAMMSVELFSSGIKFFVDRHERPASGKVPRICRWHKGFLHDDRQCVGLPLCDAYRI